MLDNKKEGAAKISDDRPTVMICDDEPDILKLYSKFIRDKYNVITATSGQGCLMQYRKEKEQGRNVEVLILDYRLGDMLGDSVACQIKKLNGTKTIMISAYDLDEEMLDGLRRKNCIAGEMKKPISLESLEGLISQVLDR
jgi:DNA-binding response OmpR family regulator